MAQIKFPVDFTQQLTLLADIIKENTRLDTDSPILAFLAENKIDLAADNQAGIDAQEQEDNRATQDAASKMAYKNRDNNFILVFKFIRAAAQVLKKFYSSNYAILHDWKIPITDSGRIDYPASFEDRNNMAAGFFTKLATFAAGKSPLDAYIKTNKIDVNLLSANNATAATNNSDGIVAAKAAENATEQRNNLWVTPLKHIHEIGDFLKSIYPDNPRALGEWGFVIDESDRKPKLRKSKLKLVQSRVVTGVAIGSVFTNTGKTVITVYKGNTPMGESATLKPQDKMGMLKGYSTITVQNTDTLESAEYTVEIQQ